MKTNKNTLIILIIFSFSLFINIKAQSDIWRSIPTPNSEIQALV